MHMWCLWGRAAFKVHIQQDNIFPCEARNNSESYVWEGKAFWLCTVFIPFCVSPHPPFINGFCNYWQQGIGSWQKAVTSAVDCLQEAGYIGCFSIEAYDVHVLSLLTPLTPKREPADMLFVFSTCLPSWMSHYLTSHKYTYRCGNTEGEACSAHIKNSYWRCQQGAQRS